MSKLNEINKRIAEMHLKPCAHCNGCAQMSYTSRISASGCFTIWCVGCGVVFEWMQSPEDAAEKWNARATDTSKDKLVAALKLAAEVFRRYEDLHARKPDVEKARRNAELAEIMEVALKEAE